MPPHPFGTLLRRRRQHADLTIELLSERSGVSPRAISDIERGMSSGPQRRTVIALADGLGLAGPDREGFLGAARPGRRGAVGGAAAVPTRPFRLPDFSGRDAEMDLLAALLTPRRVPGTPPVVVTGSAGAGKTTVALEALHRATPDGVDILFVNVGGFDALPLTPLQVLQALLRQAGQGEEPATLDDAVAAWRRACTSGERSVLLDDVTAEEQVRPVLAAAGVVRLVVTSRRSLAGLEGARRVVLGALQRQAAIDLLARIVPIGQAADGDLAELAALCADLPLALRIAGNRIASRPTWTAADFVRRLREDGTRLRHLVAGDLRVESTFAVSYEMLTPMSQEVFRSLSLMTGTSFSADAAAALNGIERGPVGEILDELADLALVEPLSGDRYRIHDLLRIFAAERLAAAHTAADIDVFRTRLRRWLLETARAMALVAEEDDAVAGEGDPTLASAREWLITEADAWLAALTAAADGPAADRVTVLATARALLRFAERWLTFPSWRAVGGIAESVAEHLADGAALADVLQTEAALELALYDGDVETARALAVRARAVAEEAGAAEAATWALICLAWSDVQEGRLAEGLEAATRALAEAVEQGSAEAQVQSRYWMATALMSEDPDAALAQAQAIRRVLDEHDGVLPLREWNVSQNAATAVAARALLRLERHAEAVEVAQRIMDDAAFFPHEPDFLARAHRHRGFAYLGLGEPEKARSDLQRALDLVQEHERPEWWAEEIRDALRSIADR